ncbi:aldolase [Tsukamurella tyrosinosolvens]|uniref:HpcH/HpaI aldolase/citrate lyase family protein n=1 Tax=Tsukamurella tyrosinosolvens TaxID=57704 RepID=A0A1H4T229_TSUTY|nr:aldolase/citrate lyase family protein [Tsukamurella tyrosinosolvens]AUN40466.1 aldolase [Tsukamurella tyrosinosolvens]KXO93313.1 aldolase [Tsukamurella tyrosinosolvens]KXP05912.1 aldolase [Tsukamurella tyrosinosolvens]KZL95746.1 aldolase [Tsukamurella tyrosinosolvens]MCA4993457.1 aldolase [Tsukamurella tyrosinosolvens]
MPSRSLTDDALAAIERRLAATDELLARNYPGDDGRRQPVHTVYLPADRFTPATAREWGEQALAAADAAGGLAEVARTVGLDDPDLPELVRRKLTEEPIEDLRLDFEDGYGDRGDEAEDADVARAVDAVTVAVREGSAPPFVGIRFKCFEAPVRARGLRTLDLFVSGLAAGGPLPEGLTITLPKVTTVGQVEAMVDASRALEGALGLDERRLRFEVQVETPQVILGADGTAPVATLLHAADGRVTSLHYGTYDYSASLGIAAQYQSMEHPAADHAKNVMQLAVAGTGVHMSDGSTNILPIGDPAHVADAWRLHARLVRRHLERGIYQGWDLHPAQLVTRFLATYAFYRDGFPAAATRLRNYVHRIDSAILDEPATARALASFIHRGVTCGAVTAAEVASAAEVTVETVRDLALNRPTTIQPEETR